VRSLLDAHPAVPALLVGALALHGADESLSFQADRLRAAATLELARAAGLRVCGTRLERVGERDALMLDRFDREWNPDANAYWRYGLVSGLTVIDAEDGYGRERWSYPLLADELRRWSIKSNDDRRELFCRKAFNAMVTNNDDHPRNHALLQTRGGWRLSPPTTSCLLPWSRSSDGSWLWRLVGSAEPGACTTSSRTAMRSGSRRKRQRH
jgi:serine/threonine protein kinase HipA of HipAB toxin-antitoxin module